MTSGTGATWRGHVIVCGLHDVGVRIVEQLRLAGEQVVVADDEPDPRLLRLSEEFGAAHLAASGRRAATLNDAGLAGAAALICAHDSDLENLEIALLARRMRPDLRVVAQLENEAVARAVARVTGEDSVLDVAAIAAPSLAEACLDLDSRAVEIDAEQFRLQELVAPADGTLRSLYDDLAPVAVSPADGSPLQVCPGRDLAVRAGDRVVVVARTAELVARGLVDEETEEAERRRRRGPLLRRYLRGFVASSETQLRWTLALLLTVAVLSVVVLRFAFRTDDGRHPSVLDAAYFTTETLTTVGFGDYSFTDQDAWLRAWAIALMVVGATLVTVLYAMFTNLLVSRRIAQSYGRQLATRMSEHVVVLGLGSVGLRVVETLVAAGQPVVVLERDEDNRFLARARALKVPVVFGDATVPASLDAVNLRRARAVAVLTSDDLTNIEAGLAVADLLGDRRADVPVVLRVFDRDLAETIDVGFGFEDVRSTAALAAPWFVGAAFGLDILTTFYVDRQPMLVGRLTVGDTGGLRGSAMADLSARIRVIALRRRGAAGLEYPPRRDTRFAGGDEAYLVGPYEELLQVLRRDQVATTQ
ncbi:Trk K+ transport system, NAD-binding component [Jatrophihabitans endophyticus]|uniref:Trk K+ transport system, NAD-binding component n=1 Tax=Jatrophihabitans endophyticus TaxID=1206085 RepID=A0A1M5P9R6_9ACTN|nr:NAD-binding protein [Jatrophihabitans endophyticus]SHG98516.1 Trk K+ transport system, NAD-binding component [Jatrophihabitans endophyticus]